jgi:hypothetical protein
MLVEKTMRDPKNIASSNILHEVDIPKLHPLVVDNTVDQIPQVVGSPYLPIQFCSEKPCEQGHQPTSTSSTNDQLGNYQLGQSSNHPSIHVDPRGGVPQLNLLLYETHELPMNFCFKETPTHQTYSEYSNFSK